MCEVMVNLLSFYIQNIVGKVIIFVHDQVEPMALFPSRHPHLIEFSYCGLLIENTLYDMWLVESLIGFDEGVNLAPHNNG